MGTIIIILLLSDSLFPLSPFPMGKWEKLRALCAASVSCRKSVSEWGPHRASAQANWDWSHHSALGKGVPPTAKTMTVRQPNFPGQCGIIFLLLYVLYVIYMQTHIHIYINIHTYMLAQAVNIFGLYHKK